MLYIWYELSSRSGTNEEVGLQSTAPPPEHATPGLGLPCSLCITCILYYRPSAHEEAGLQSTAPPPEHATPGLGLPCSLCITCILYTPQDECP